tara:strand:+ start:28933 stop:29373 length:441 start_codon:yes stop_codon:yes gene_type:complete
MTSNLYGITPTKSTIKSLVDTQNPLKTGLRYPIGKDGVLFSKASKGELLKGQVFQLIFTTPGERVMLPNFGLYIRQYLFSPITSSIVEKIKKDIYRQVEAYIPSAQVLQVEVNEVEETGTNLPGISIKLSLREKETNEIIPMEFNL